MEYKVYKDEGGKIQAVKDGFCWLAFVFGWLWALSANKWGQMKLYICSRPFRYYLVVS